MRIVAAVLTVTTLLACPAPEAFAAGGASFDCAAATTVAERGICAAPPLAMLDGVLGGLYARAKAAPGAPATLTGDQRAWMARRDDCWKTGAPELCAKQEYVKRIAALAAGGAAVIGDAPIVGPLAVTCDKIDAPMAAVFINTDPGFLSLAWGDMSLVLNQTISASGARFSDEDDGGHYIFWEKGREATFEGPALMAPSQCTLAG